MDKSKLNAAERDLVEGLEGFLEDLKSGKPLGKKYTCRRVVLDVQPAPFTGERVRAVRMLLNASQPFFAQFLGVSVKTLRAWEGGKTPNNMACRFMDEIDHNPDYWKSRLKQSVKSKTHAGPRN